THNKPKNCAHCGEPKTFLDSITSPAGTPRPSPCTKRALGNLRTSPPTPSPKATNHHGYSVKSLMPDSLSNSRTAPSNGTPKHPAKLRSIVSSSDSRKTAQPPRVYGTIPMSLVIQKKNDQPLVSTPIWWTHQTSWWKNETNHSATSSQRLHSAICPETAVTSSLKSKNTMRSWQTLLPPNTFGVMWGAENSSEGCPGGACGWQT